MSVAEIARALGDERKHGRDIKCRCPLCGGRLALRDGDRGLLAKCWGGCEVRDVYAELWRLGYLSNEQPAPPSPEEVAARNAAADCERQRRIAAAMDLWSEGRLIPDTLADRYLRVARGIDVLSPYIGETAANTLSFHPRCWHSSPGVYRPAMLAKIEHVELGFIGVSATYLAIDGSGKTTLDPPRKIFGCCQGGAVRLGKPRKGKWLALGEGIETALSIMQACALPAWAALSANGVKNAVLPAQADMVVVAADNDRNGVGQRAARTAAERFLTEGRRVRVALPPLGGDFNDLLLSGAAATIEGASDAGT